MRVRPLLCILVAFTAAGVVYSQQQQGPGSRSADAEQGRGQIDVNVLQVPLMVSVTDSKGKLIPELGRNDFKVYEDDKLQTIRSFNRETDLPLSIALLIDSSGSVIEQLKFERAAATDFFFNTIKRKKDRATVLYFDSTVNQLDVGTRDGFTDEAEKLAEAVRLIKAGGGTAVFDAIYIAVQKALSHEEGERRKLIILISEGEDTASRLSRS